MSRGLTKDGIEALDSALARHVERGDLPGLVALVARGDDVHVAAIGHQAFDDAEPIGRDAIFRIASITKPIAGAAAMLLVGDHSGWGLMMLVPAGDGSTGIPGGYGWEGGSGTAWRTDTAVGLTGILLTQRMVTSPVPAELVTDFWTAAYAAIDT